LADDPRKAQLSDFQGGDAIDERLRVGSCGLVGTLADLLPGERGYVESSVPSRQIEFATGRLLARKLLRDLGYPDTSIERDDDRVPVWPSGVVGSISHTDSACLVAVSSDPSLLGVGVDVEVDEPRTQRFLERITSAVERARFTDPSAALQAVTQIFSIKEAVYKACFPALREHWGFKDVDVTLDSGSQRFRAALPTSAGGAIEGVWRERDGRIWTLACWERRSG